MRGGYPTLFILFFSIIIVHSSSGQGWQWGAGSTHGAEGMDLTTDRNGNVIAIGYNYGNYSIFGSDTIPATPGGSGAQGIIAKYSPAGAQLWVRGLLDGGAQPIGVTTDLRGNIYFFGCFFDPALKVGPYTLTNPGGSPYFLVKYDPSGNVMWARQGGPRIRNNTPIARLGGIAADTMGHLYLAASYLNNMTVGSTTVNSAGQADLFIAKYDTNGNGMWVKDAGGSKNELMSDITLNAAGELIITGTFFSNSVAFGSTILTNPGVSIPASSIFLAKYDTAGNAIWAKAAGGESEYVGEVVCDNDNNIFICGQFAQSSLSFGGVSLSNPYTYPEAFLTKFDSAGNALWAKGITTPKYKLAGIVGYALATTPCNDVWMCGRMDSLIYIDGTAVYLPARSYDEFFLAGYSSSGTALGHTTLPYGGDDVGGLASDKWGNLFIANDYMAGPFTLGAVTLSDAPVAENMFVAKYVPPSSYADTLSLSSSDTTVCAGVWLTLQAPPGFRQYKWSNGATSESITVTDTGTYIVYGMTPCSSVVVDTFRVKIGGVGDTFSLGNDTVVCSGLLLTVPVAAQTYTWQDGSTNRSILAGKTGTYYVTIDNGGCKASDTISVVMPDLVQHLEDTVICTSEKMQLVLNANVPAGAEAIWNTGSTAASVAVADTGYYSVVVRQGDCSDSASCHVAIEICDCEAVLPNAFTPNDDGLNDGYSPILPLDCEINNYVFRIFNRWGQEVFYSTKPGEKWDGKLLGVDAELCTYMYYLSYKAGYKEVKHFHKGDITLIR